MQASAAGVVRHFLHSVHFSPYFAGQRALERDSEGVDFNLLEDSCKQETTSKTRRVFGGGLYGRGVGDIEKQGGVDAVQVLSADDLAAYCESVLRRYSVMHRENRWAVVEGARYLLDRQYPDGWQMESDVQQPDARRAVRKPRVPFDNKTDMRTRLASQRSRRCPSVCGAVSVPRAFGMRLPYTGERVPTTSAQTAHPVHCLCESGI